MVRTGPHMVGALVGTQALDGVSVIAAAGIWSSGASCVISDITFADALSKSMVSTKAVKHSCLLWSGI